jgi:hypothetical protein
MHGAERRLAGRNGRSIDLNCTGGSEHKLLPDDPSHDNVKAEINEPSNYVRGYIATHRAIALTPARSKGKILNVVMKPLARPYVKPHSSVVWSELNFDNRSGPTAFGSTFGHCTPSLLSLSL